MDKKYLFFTLSILMLINVSCKDKKANKTGGQDVTGLDAHQKKTQSIRTQAYTPEEELAGFNLPDGFVIELVASEKDGVINPIDLTFDDAGRLWTQTARMYPLDPVADIAWDTLIKLMDNPEAQEKNPDFKRILDLYRGKTKGDDKILVLSNLYGRNKVQVRTWADGLAIPQSILPYKDGCIVAQGSELFFLKDGNGDGVADSRTGLFTGFGFTDTHTMVHTLVRAPGDWVHFSHGALNKGEVSSLAGNTKTAINYSKIGRFSLDAKELELVSSGLNNIWGFQMRGNGQWYGCEANDLGYSVVPMEAGTGFPGIGNDRIRPYQPWMPELHDFRVGGTGISGLAFADDLTGSFPDEWKDVALLANPITSAINAVRIVRNPDGSVTAEHLPDFLTSADDWFRPVNMEFGPDGSLYIADWYNKIISHNELPTTHPDRDKTHGRIWRIRHKSQLPREIPNLYKVRTQDLVKFLKSPAIWEKRAAWHQITDRPISETSKLARELVSLAGNSSQDQITRIHAIWSLEGIHHYDRQLFHNLLRSPGGDLRREAVRALTSFSLSAQEISEALVNLIEDSNVMVRSQVLRTLDGAGVSNPAIIELLVKACKPELEGNAMGGPYERKFERFLARRALEQYPKELQAYINSPAANKVPVKNLLWAIQALPKEEKELAFLKFWPKAGIAKLDEPTFISIAGMLNNRKIYQMVKPVVQNQAYAATYIQFALQNQARVQSSELSRLLYPGAHQLLLSDSLSAVNLALDAAGRLNIQNLRESVIAIIKQKQTPDKTLILALKVLENDPEANKAVFAQAAQNEQLSFDARVSALHSLSKVDSTKGLEVIRDWIPELHLAEKKLLASVLAGSRQGGELLTDMFDEERLPLAAFDISTAEQIYKSNKQDLRGAAILNGVKKREEEEKQAFNAKFDRYMAIAKEKKGNPKNGQVLFQTCLLCHTVGDQGKDIAPALDGSANRESQALLTAILDPNAAVEAGYRIFSVVKKDGSSIQGHLINRDELGTTIAFMGGSELFIAAGDIKSERFLDRSFMTEGLTDSYTDEQIADLLAYIRTLK